MTYNSRIHFIYDMDEGWIASRDLSDPDEPRGTGETRVSALIDMLEGLAHEGHPAMAAALHMLRMIETERGLIYRKSVNGGRVPA